MGRRHRSRSTCEITQNAKSYTLSRQHSFVLKKGQSAFLCLLHDSLNFHAVNVGRCIQTPVGRLNGHVYNAKCGVLSYYILAPR